MSTLPVGSHAHVAVAKAHAAKAQSGVRHVHPQHHASNSAESQKSAGGTGGPQSSTFGKTATL